MAVGAVSSSETSVCRSTVMLAPWRRLQRVANAVSAPSSEPPYQDETSAPADWRAHAPREEIRPAFGYSASTGTLMITTDERAGLNGSWARSVPVRGGETYEFTARLRPTNVPLPRRCAVTRVLWQDAEGGSVLCDEPGTAGPGRSDGSEAQTAGRSVAEPEYPVEDEPAVAGRWCAPPPPLRRRPSSSADEPELWCRGFVRAPKSRCARCAVCAEKPHTRTQKSSRIQLGSPDAGASRDGATGEGVLRGGGGGAP